jgi:hypothetical protein
VPRNNIQLIWQRSFNSKDKPLGKALYVPSNTQALKSCMKSGSWIPARIPLPRKYRWTSKYLPYFSSFPNLHKSLTVQTDLITSVELLEVSNCKVSRDFSTSTSLNIYQSTLNIEGEGGDIDAAILLDISGSESFQHFVQDAMPILSLIAEVPDYLQNVPILIPQPAKSFKSFLSYIEAMRLPNKIVFISPESVTYVKKLYVFNFKPFNMMYGLPSDLYHNSYRLVNGGDVAHSKNEGVLLLERKENSRNFKNFHQISRQISTWANSQNLSFSSIDTSTLEFKEIREKFRKAKFIFAIHGGANYNIVWARLDTTLVEFIPVVATDSLSSLALSYGLNYMPFALNHDKGDFEFEIKEEDLNSIFEILASGNLDFDAER